MEKLPINKMDTWRRNLSPWGKRVGGWERTKATWRRMKQTPLRRNDNWSCWCWNDRIHLKRDTLVEKDWQDNLDYPEWLVFKSEYENTILERYGINTWHWSNSNTTTQNKNKGLACRISRNKHMLEISSEVFVVGPTRARSYSTIMYKAVHMTYEASPSRHSQGLFKTQRDNCKTNRE